MYDKKRQNNGISGALLRAKHTSRAILHQASIAHEHGLLLQVRTLRDVPILAVLRALGNAESK